MGVRKGIDSMEAKMEIHSYDLTKGWFVTPNNDGSMLIENRNEGTEIHLSVHSVRTLRAILNKFSDGIELVR